MLPFVSPTAALCSTIPGIRSAASFSSSAKLLRSGSNAWIARNLPSVAATCLAHGRPHVRAAVRDDLALAQPERRARRQHGEILVLEARGDLSQARSVERETELEHRVERGAAPVVGERRAQPAPLILACERPLAHDRRRLIDRGKVELADRLDDVAHVDAGLAGEGGEHGVPERAVRHVDGEEPGVLACLLAERRRRPARRAVDALVAVVIVDDGDQPRASLGDHRPVDGAEVRVRREERHRAGREFERLHRVLGAPVAAAVIEEGRSVHAGAPPPGPRPWKMRTGRSNAGVSNVQAGIAA